MVTVLGPNPGWAQSQQATEDAAAERQIPPSPLFMESRSPYRSQPKPLGISETCCRLPFAGRGIEGYGLDRHAAANRYPDSPGIDAVSAAAVPTSVSSTTAGLSVGQQPFWPTRAFQTDDKEPPAGSSLCDVE